LEHAGILRSKDGIVAVDVKNIPYAYVLFDRHRVHAVPYILSELKRRGIYSIGRYGLWEHTSMEDAIGQGRSMAESLRSLQIAA
jgi:protoporphyrinogen oxidase